MEKIIYFLLLFVSCPFYVSYSQVKFEWANTMIKCSPGKILLDVSGDIYLSGSIEGPFSRFDMIFIKFNPSGNQIWMQTFADTITPYPNNGNGAGNILFDDSSNIFLGDSRLWKYNNEGQLLWNMYPGIYRGFARIFFDSVFNILTSVELANSSFFIRKYSYNGDSLWSRIFKPAGTIAARWRGAVADSKDNIITAGYMNKTGLGSYYDYMTVKYSGNGDLIGQVIFSL